MGNDIFPKGGKNLAGIKEDAQVASSPTLNTHVTPARPDLTGKSGEHEINSKQGVGFIFFKSGRKVFRPSPSKYSEVNQRSPKWGVCDETERTRREPRLTRVFNHLDGGRKSLVMMT
jgi:hypothetical protein